MRLLLLSPCFYTLETTTTSADYYSTTTESYNYDDLPKDISDIFDNFEESGFKIWNYNQLKCV